MGEVTPTVADVIRHADPREAWPAIEERVRCLAQTVGDEGQAEVDRYGESPNKVELAKRLHDAADALHWFNEIAG